MTRYARLGPEVMLVQWPLRGVLNQRGGAAAGRCLCAAAGCTVASPRPVAAGHRARGLHRMTHIGHAAELLPSRRSTRRRRGRNCAGSPCESNTNVSRASSSYIGPPLYLNCSNWCSVGGSRTGPPRAAITARVAAHCFAVCFFVRPRVRVFARNATRRAGARSTGDGVRAEWGCFIAPLLHSLNWTKYFCRAGGVGYAAEAAAGWSRRRRTTNPGGGPCTPTCFLHSRHCPTLRSKVASTGRG